MPHAIIEYSLNLQSLVEEQSVCEFVHHTMIHCGLFTPADIKTRAYPAHDFRVGLRGQAGRFMHITVALLEGRTTEQKQLLSEALRNGVAALMPGIHQLSVEIRDMSRDSYRKHVTD